MAFRILKNSTTADASDVNDNFFWGGQGSILPMGGNDLDYTTGVYDIGSAAYKWNTLYCGTVTADEVHTGGLLWEYVDREVLTGATTTISLTGLNGDNNNEYMLIFYFIKQTAPTHDYVLNINNTIGSMVINFYRNSTGIGVGESNETGGIIAFNKETSTLSNYTFGRVSIKSESSSHSIIQFQSAGGNTGAIGDSLLGIGIDKDNSSTLTSIQMKCKLRNTTTADNFEAGSYIDLWRIPH